MKKSILKHRKSPLVSRATPSTSTAQRRHRKLLKKLGGVR